MNVVAAALGGAAPQCGDDASAAEVAGNVVIHHQGRREGGRRPLGLGIGVGGAEVGEAARALGDGEAGGRQRLHVEGAHVPPRSVPAVAAYGQVDDARVALGDRLDPEAQPLDAAAAEAVDEDVGVGDQRGQRGRKENDMPRPSVRRDTWKWLALWAFGGKIFVIALTALLARHLNLAQFEVYAVAAALFLIMATVAPLGADKLALRMLPIWLEVGDMPRAAGFQRFALRKLAFGTLAAAAVGLAWVLSRENALPIRAAIAAAALALPGAVLAQMGLEVLTAAGRVREATMIVRIAVPGSVLLLVAGFTAAGATLTGAAAIAAWGFAWTAALIPLLLLLRRDMAGESGGFCEARRDVVVRREGGRRLIEAGLNEAAVGPRYGRSNSRRWLRR